MKKIFVFIISFFICVSAYCDEQILPNSTLNSLIGSGTPSYQNPWGMSSSGWHATEGDRQIYMPTGGAIKELRVFYGATVANPNTLTFTVRVNGSATSLTCTITGGASTCSDTSDSATVAAGDLVVIEKATSGTVTNSLARFSVLFDGSTSAESVFAGVTEDDLNATTTEYNAFYGRVAWGSSETSRKTMISTGGTIKKLYISLTGTAGASKSYAFTVYKNGSSTSLTCTVSGASDTTCSDTSNSFSVAAGDYITIQSAPSGTPTVRDAKWSVVFEATTAGEFVIPTIYTPNSNSAVTYWAHGGTGGSTSTSGNSRQPTYSGFTQKNQYVLLDTDPGGSGSWVFSNENGTGSNVTISSGSTTGNATGDVTWSDSGSAELTTTPSSTPTSSVVYIGITGYNAPTVSSARRRISYVE